MYICNCVVGRELRPKVRFERMKGDVIMSLIGLAIGLAMELVIELVPEIRLRLGFQREMVIFWQVHGVVFTLPVLHWFMKTEDKRWRERLLRIQRFQ